MNRTSNHFIHLRSISWNVVSAQFAEKYLISKKKRLWKWHLENIKAWTSQCNVATCQKIFQDATASTASHKKKHGKNVSVCDHLRPPISLNWIVYRRFLFLFPLYNFLIKYQLSRICGLYIRRRIFERAGICSRFLLFRKIFIIYYSEFMGGTY